MVSARGLWNISGFFKNPSRPGGMYHLCQFPNRELVSPRSLVPEEVIRCFAHVNSTWFEIYLWQCKQTYHRSHVVVDFFWRRIFFCRGIFLPGTFSVWEFFACSQESSSYSSDSNLRLEYYVVVPWSYDTLDLLALTHLHVQTPTVAWFLGLIIFLLHRLSTNQNRRWSYVDAIVVNIGFATERRMPSNPFFGDVTGGADVSDKFVPFEFG